MNTDANSIETQTIALLQNANKSMDRGLPTTALQYIAKANGFYHGARNPHGRADRPVFNICRALSRLEQDAVNFAVLREREPAFRSAIVDTIDLIQRSRKEY